MSLVFNLPLSYASRIAAVPGVKRVATTSWFGGSLPAKKEGKADEGSETTTDWSNFFPNMAVDADPYFAMYPEFEIPPDQYKAFKEDLQGAVIGRKLATKFNWKLGDHFFLESFIPPYRKKSGPFEFTVRAIFDTDPVKHPNTDTNLMLFHYKYLYEGTGQHIAAGTYNIEITDPSQAGAVSKAIDAQFENSDAQTHTETEQAFAASFIAMAGNLAFLLNSIGLAVSFTILLVTANTMSMAVRERRMEIAVLKTLGFSSRQVMALILTEAVAIGAVGGVLGVGGAALVIRALPKVPALGGFINGLPNFGLHAAVTSQGLSIALLLALAAGLSPALGAYRARIVDMLRQA